MWGVKLKVLSSSDFRILAMSLSRSAILHFVSCECGDNVIKAYRWIIGDSCHRETMNHSISVTILLWYCYWSQAENILWSLLRNSIALYWLIHSDLERLSSSSWGSFAFSTEKDVPSHQCSDLYMVISSMICKEWCMRTTEIASVFHWYGDLQVVLSSDVGREGVLVPSEEWDLFSLA